MALAATSPSPSPSPSHPKEQLVTFVFGDSLTEVGNNNHFQYSLARSDYPWYGVDFPGGQATGRFTNGRTIGDIICT
ncbi:GDSL esterase/lipase At5g37690 [Linum perenne]